MKPTDKVQHLRDRLRNLALATSLGTAMFLGSGTEARADLIGHWFSGAESLADSSGFTTAGTHDGVAVGGNAGLLAYSEDVPTGFTGKSLDLRAGNVAVEVANTATIDTGYVNTFDGGVSSKMTIAFWAKGFPNDWAPWISKRGEDGIGWQVRRFANSTGPCFTVRGVDNEDAGGSPLNVSTPLKWRHFAAVWDQETGSRSLYVDGVLSHTVYNAFGQNMSLATATHLGIGGRQGSGPGFESYFAGLLFDVRVYNEAFEQQQVFDLIPQAPPQGLTATPGAGKMHLTWTPNLGAASYTISTRNTVTNAVTTDVVTEPPFTKFSLVNGTQYAFKILATNGGGSGVYSAEVNGTPGTGTGKDILSFEFDGIGPAKITGTDIVKYVPNSVDVSILTASYTVSPFAFEDETYPSGSFRDFTTDQTYTIKAEDNSLKTYTVHVEKADPLVYTFDNDLQGWTQFWPISAPLWENGGLGNGTDSADTRYGRSPDFYLNNSGPLTFELAGGPGALEAPNVSPSMIPSNAIDEGGFSGVALRDVATNTYILVKRRSGTSGGYTPYSFTEAELAPYANDGKRYTLDFIDYNKGSWGWVRMDNISIPGILAPPVEPDPEANILEFTLNVPSTIKMDGTNITITLPFGTPVTALAPTFILSSGATSDKPSGSAQNFTTPVTYTITSSDEEVIKAYTATAVVQPDPADSLVGHWVSGAESLADTSGYGTPGTHDGTAIGTNAGLLAYSTDVPPGFTGKSLDLRAGNVGVSINNSSSTDGGYVNTFDEQVRSQLTISFWAKGFPGTWSPWVAKGGEGGVGWQIRRVDADPVAGFTIRGLGNEDGRGSQIPVNQDPPVWHHYAGVWDEATGVRALYIDGVLSHNVNTLGQMMNLAANRHLALGARQNDPNADYFNYFAGLLYDVRIYKQKLFINQVQALAAPASFTNWIATNYPGLSDKSTVGDPDGDGLSNFEEFIFGLNPESGASSTPIVTQLDKTTGNFSYTRTNPALTGLDYKIMTSTDLESWVEDTAATAGQTVSSTSGDKQTMNVTLTGAPLTGAKVFVRVLAE